MAHQVNRPNPDELAQVVHVRDFTRLRDIVRNRPAMDLAGVLIALPIEDQVLVFRTLPRKVAASTFGYLAQDAQEALLKAMAQEDVAALLDHMAPDDRTSFFEELPAGVTRQLLALLTPDERAVAVTLLGYPEDSIGRLMTPDYIAVSQEWSVQAVLDYVREHGHDSETLNVVYVVDTQGLLIDDIRIREFLLTSPSNTVSDLMDRRLMDLGEQEPYKTRVKFLRSFKGIDALSALTILVETPLFERFDRARAFMSYTGLVCRERSSGGRQWRGAITKAGNAHIRRVLIEGAWGYRHRSRMSRALTTRRKDIPVPVLQIARKAENRLHRKFSRLTRRGIPSQKVVVAVAREFSGFIWAMAKEFPAVVGS